MRCVAVSVILKVAVLTEAVDSVLNEQLRIRFAFDAVLVSVGMIFSIVSALVLATIMAARQLIVAARKPVLKLLATKSAPEMPLGQGQKWHLFLCATRDQPTGERPPRPIA